MKASFSSPDLSSTPFQLNSLRDSRQLEYYLEQSQSEQVFIYANAKGDLNLIGSTAEIRSKSANATRKKIASQLVALGKASSLGGLLNNIRSHASKIDGQKSCLAIDRKILLNLIQEHRLESAQLAEKYKNSSAPTSLKKDLKSVEKLLRELFKTPPRVMDTPDIDFISEVWAERCLSTYWDDASNPSQEQQIRFQLLLLVEPDKTLADAFVTYAKENFSTLPEDETLEKLAYALVSQFKTRLSTANCNEAESLVQIGQRKLEPFGPAHQGAYGKVQVFVDQDDPEFSVAVKFPIDMESRPNALEETRVELAGQLLANSPPHENVVGINGAIRLEDQLILLVENCNGGTLAEVRERVISAFSKGKMKDQIAGLVLLTLAKDMLSGLSHLHKVCGVTHGDMKLHNVFLGTDGRAKVGDFDKTRSGSSYAIGLNELPQAIQFLSPEIIRELSGIFDQIDAARSKPKSGKEIQALREKARVQLSQASDCFAAGIALFELCYGINPLDRLSQNSRGGRELEDIRLSAIEFSASTPVVRFEKLFNGATIHPSLSAHEDQLRRTIFSLMAADPEFRSTAGKALENPVFSLQGLGSEEIRKTLASI